MPGCRGCVRSEPGPRYNSRGERQPRGGAPVTALGLQAGPAQPLDWGTAEAIAATSGSAIAVNTDHRARAEMHGMVLPPQAYILS